MRKASNGLDLALSEGGAVGFGALGLAGLGRGCSMARTFICLVVRREAPVGFACGGDPVWPEDIFGCAGCGSLCVGLGWVEQVVGRCAQVGVMEGGFCSSWCRACSICVS